MIAGRSSRFALAAVAALVAACASSRAVIPVSRDTVAPATGVTRRGVPVRLLGTPVAVGNPLPATALVDADTLQTVDLSRERGRVLFLSLIVSIDTGL
jgi:thiol peroxidase